MALIQKYAISRTSDGILRRLFSEYVGLSVVSGTGPLGELAKTVVRAARFQALVFFTFPPTARYL
jgi:hypothetical protein